MKKIILISILVFSMSFSVFAQAMDLILLIDSSRSMSSNYRETSDYLTGAFLSEFLQLGDTIHLISFSDNPRLEMSRRIDGAGDLEALIARILLIYPIDHLTNDSSVNISNALSFAERYISNLPENRPKKLILVTNDNSASVMTVVDSSSSRLSPNGTDLHFVLTPVTGAGPQSGRLAQALPPMASAPPATQPPAATPPSTATTPPPATGTTPPPSSAPPPSTSVQPGTTSPQTGTTPPSTATTPPAAGTPPSTTVPPAAGTTSPATDTTPPSTTQPPATGTVPPSTATTPPTTPSTTPPAAGTTPPIETAPPPAAATPPAATPQSGTQPSSTPQGSSGISSFFQGESLQNLIIVLIILALLALALIIFLVSRRLTGSPRRAAVYAAGRKRDEEEEKNNLARFNQWETDAENSEQPDMKENAKLLNNFAENKNQRSTGIQDKKPPIPIPIPKNLSAKDENPFPDEPIREGEPLMLNLFVSDQNTAIGRRNIHRIKSGDRLSIGGGKSDFLIFLVPFPQNIAYIQFNGKTCNFIPRMHKYFPDLGGRNLNDCMGKNIRVVSDRKYELFIRLERYRDPLKSLNELMNSISIPGETTK